VKRCNVCLDRDETVSFRERSQPGLRVLCSACYVDARSSSVRQVCVPERVQQDRYAQMAVRYNVS
jgi:hypothetical protein